MSQSSTHLPSVVIVGRPNVGKSTLFNAITGQRRSIVGDEPGITRDRIYGEANHRGRKFELVDTGGIIPNDEEMIPSQILKQARMALDDAAQIIFLIDGRTEITGIDRDLAQMLRKIAKPVTLVVNKIDSPRRDDLVHEFHSLGFEAIYPVSAEHRLGMEDLLDHITSEFPRTEQPEEKKRTPDKKERDAKAAEDAGPKEVFVHPSIKVAIIGRPNVGKSTLLNALTGMERAIVSPIAGTTRDAVDETMEHAGKSYTFVDTAGIRRKGKTTEMAEKLSVVMARRHLRMSHVAIIVLDATDGVVALDATIAGYAHEEGRAVILCVNKWDSVEDKNKKKFIEDIKDSLKFLDWAPIVFVSAQKKAGTGALFPLIQRVYEAASRRVTTGELNRFKEALSWEQDMKIYYLTQASVRPPTFIVFTDKGDKLHFSAERYLANRLRERFDFLGSPIEIKTKRR
ncbi:MAG: ribosome biogenesis GTPase Der [Bryobacteraceae bacterium]